MARRSGSLVECCRSAIPDFSGLRYRREGDCRTCRAWEALVCVCDSQGVAGLSCQVWKRIVSLGPMLSKSQNFGIAHLLSQCWIQAGAPLLDERKVKPRRERDRLQVSRNACRWIARIAAGRIVIRSRNRRVLPYIQAGHGLNERRA